MKEIVLTSSILILVILGARWVFRKWVSKRLVYGVWLLVALRLLIPVQVGSFDFSFLTPVEPLTDAMAELSQAPITGPSRQEVYRQIAQDHIREGFSVSDPQVMEQIDLEVEAALNAPTLGDIAAAVWLLGAVFMGVWFLCINIRHKKRVFRGATVFVWNKSPIPVMVSDQISSPCLVGYFRPVILLTPESTGLGTIKYVLAHELTHYRQKDHIWSLVRCVCLCLYWFHPLVWVAAFISRRDCELACDEKALALLGEEERIAYGKTLIDIVSRASGRIELLQAATNMSDTKAQLSERVKYIVKKPKTFITAAVCMFLVCVTCAGCAFLGGSSDPTEPTQSQFSATESPTTPTESENAAQTDTVYWADGIGTFCSFNTPYPSSCAQAVVYILENHDTVYSTDYQLNSGKNPHYVGNDGNIYFVTGRNTIVRCLADGSRVLVIYKGEDILHPIACDGDSFFFTEGSKVMVLDCSSGEAHAFQR